MKVEVEYGLSRAFAVVLEDVESVARQGFGDVRGDFFDPLYGFGKNIIVRLRQIGEMFFRDNESMPFGERVYVEICVDGFVFVYFETWNFACRYGAEYAIVFHTRYSTKYTEEIKLQFRNFQNAICLV